MHPIHNNAYVVIGLDFHSGLITLFWLVGRRRVGAAQVSSLLEGSVLNDQDSFKS